MNTTTTLAALRRLDAEMTRCDYQRQVAARDHGPDSAVAARAEEKYQVARQAFLAAAAEYHGDAEPWDGVDRKG